MKWLLQNVRGRAKYALKNPRYAMTVAWNELTLADERFLCRITGDSAKAIRMFLEEPVTTPEFQQHLKEKGHNFRGLAITSADIYAKKVLNQYAVIRALRPSCVVETGIANGVSAAYILLALKKNGSGFLHSVGLPDPAFLPAGMEAGWFVPNWLREAWKKHFGDAREILPPLLRQLGEIDVFIHDSLHTYEHMYWEFETAYPFLRPGGVLLADDALFNLAFQNFVRERHLSHARVLRGVGVLLKNEMPEETLR